MAFYVTLARFTEKGLHDVKDTVKRGEAFASHAKTYGATVKEFLWTQGAFDMVTIIEAPDDETVAALVLDALKLGNVTCETSRGFTASEMEKILARMR